MNLIEKAHLIRTSSIKNISFKKNILLPMNIHNMKKVNPFFYSNPQS